MAEQNVQKLMVNMQCEIMDEMIRLAKVLGLRRVDFIRMALLREIECQRKLREEPPFNVPERPVTGFTKKEAVAG